MPSAARPPLFALPPKGLRGRRGSSSKSGPQLPHIRKRSSEGARFNLDRDNRTSKNNSSSRGRYFLPPSKGCQEPPQRQINQSPIRTEGRLRSKPLRSSRTLCYPKAVFKKRTISQAIRLAAAASQRSGDGFAKKRWNHCKSLSIGGPPVRIAELHPMH